MADAGNYFETELLKDLDNEIRAGSIMIGPDSVEYFSRLAECYPVAGSKIQWSKVPDSIELSEKSDDLQQTAFSDFFGKIVARYGLNGQAIYMGIAQSISPSCPLLKSLLGIWARFSRFRSITILLRQIIRGVWCLRLRAICHLGICRSNLSRSKSRRWQFCVGFFTPVAGASTSLNRTPHSAKRH